MPQKPYLGEEVEKDEVEEEEEEVGHYALLKGQFGQHLKLFVG